MRSVLSWIGLTSLMWAGSTAHGAILTTVGNTATDSSATTADGSTGDLGIKTNSNGANNRVTWINFNRSAAEASITSASVGLTVAVQGGAGAYTFSLYGIPNLDAKDGFVPSATNFANSTPDYVVGSGTRVGTIPVLLTQTTVTAPGTGGAITFSPNSALTSFLNADTNGTVSFLVSVASGGTGSWAIYGLGTGATNAAKLQTNADAVPEPVSLGFVGLCSVAMLRRVRRV